MMKLAIFLLIFVVSVTISNAFEVKRHKLIGAVKIVKRRSIVFDDVDPASTCSTAQKFSTFCATSPSCESNGQIFQCLPNGKYSLTTCKNQKPYCVGSGGFSFCSSEPDATACASEYYQCLGNGVYPELDSCRSYYNCSLNADETAVTAQKFTCDRGFVFNPIKGCTRGLCNKPACRNNKRTVWRPLNYLGFDRNRMGLLCVAGNPTFIYSCPNNMQLDLDSTSEPKCILKCTLRTQIAPSLDDNTKYLQCKRGKVEEKYCDPDFIFDSYKLKCIKSQTTTTTSTEGTTPVESTSTDPQTTSQPSTNPNTDPQTTSQPSTNPSTDPQTTSQPSTNPSTDPQTTSQPSTNPSTDPQTTSQPSTNPSTDPQTTSQPSTNPSTDPQTTSQPSTNPSTDSQTTSQPSTNPSTDPQTTSQPSTNPSTDPQTTSQPSTNPSTDPQTTSQPSTNPSTDLPTTTIGATTTDISTTV